VTPFRIRKDAKNWFRDLRATEFKTDFDAFYFCFIAGITTGNKDTNITVSDTDELVAYFPDRYRSRGRLLVALFLTRELRERGVGMGEREAVHAKIELLVDPTAPNHLTDEGVREFNKYSWGGYEVLLSKFYDRPRTLDSFLREFKRMIDEQTDGTLPT
jgi:hypothetical protein